MACRRFQKPNPKKHGGWWTIRVREDVIENGEFVRRNKRVRLLSDKKTFRQAQQEAELYLSRINQGLQPVGSSSMFEDFVRNKYLKYDLLRTTKAAPTKARYLGVVENHLIPRFGKFRLRDISPLVLQDFFTGIPQDPKLRSLSRESVAKLRDVMKAIMRSAIKYRMIVGNPMDEIELPCGLAQKNHHKPFLRPEQVEQLLALIAEPYATMVYVALCSGLRVSELVGLRWNDIHEDAITVDERYCRGDLYKPKTEASCTTVPVPAAVIRRIEALKSMIVHVRAGRSVRKYRVVKSCEPTDFVFQSVRTGSPMRDNNILSRHIKPAAETLGIPWVNWLVLRRSFGTWLVKYVKADIKDAQAQMRHSRASTTLDWYAQFVPESQRKVADRLGELITVTVQ